MTWQIVVTIATAVSVLRDAITKRITAHMHPMVYQVPFYVGAVIAASTISWFVFHLNPFIGGMQLWYLRIFGILFGVGVYFMFEAMKINFTKYQTFSPYRNLITVLLSFLFLGELSLLDLHTAKGIRFIFGFVLFILALIISKPATKEQQGIQSRQNLFWAYLIPNMLILGSAMFLVKVFVQNIPPIVVLTNQYIGSLFAISLLVSIQKLKLPDQRRYIAMAFLNGGVTAISLTLLYMALQLGPASAVNSVYALLGLPIAIPVGLFIFNEKKLITKSEAIAIIIGLIGAVLLILP